MFMKKQFFLMGMAALAFVSCSKDETAEVNHGDAIGFRTPAITRGTETTLDGLGDFYVTAYEQSGNANYFTNVQFTKSGNEYTSTPEYYWPASGNLTFYAFWPGNDLSNKMNISNGKQELTDFEPATLISAQQDVIVATATGNKTANEETGVALNFKHVLSQILVKAKNTNSNYTYKVKGVRIGMPVSKGSLDLSTITSITTWTPSAGPNDKAKYEITYDTEHTLSGEPVSIMDQASQSTNGAAMLIPQQLVAWDPSDDPDNTKSKGAYLSVNVQIMTAAGAQVYPKNDGDFGWVAVPIGTNWEAGKKYTYTLDFSTGGGKVDPEDPDNPGTDVLGGAIKFTVTVDSWTDSAQNVEM